MGGGPSSRRDASSTQLGPNVLGPVIAQSESSTVYLARDPRGRSLAVKTSNAGVTQETREKQRRKWLREVHNSKRLAHVAGVIRIANYDLRETTDTPYLAAQFISGKTLRTLLHERRDSPDFAGLPLVEALNIFARLAYVLDGVHRAGVAHCDIKPSNVMLSAGGDTFLMGFASALSEDDMAGRSGHNSGTVAYMAPELGVARNRKSTRLRKQADLYALGVLLYEMLDGTTPLQRAHIEDTSKQVVFQQQTGLHGPQAGYFLERVPPLVRPLIEAATEPNPYKRPGAYDLMLWAEELIQQLAHPELANTGHGRAQRKLMEWLRRYGPLEIAGTASALVTGIAVFGISGRLLSGALAASIAEAIGYFLCAVVFEVRRQNLKTDASDTTTTVFWRTIRGMLFEFGPAEFIDDFFVRPAAMYIAAQLLGSFVGGLIVGKLIADAVFYTITIISYETRKLLWSDARMEPIGAKQ